MTDVAYAKDIYKSTREIKLLIFGYLDWSSTQNTISVLNSRKTIVHVTHIPVNPVAVLPCTQKLEEPIKHLPFESVVMLSDFCKFDVLFLGNLVNRK